MTPDKGDALSYAMIDPMKTRDLEALYAQDETDYDPYDID